MTGVKHQCILNSVRQFVFGIVTLPNTSPVFSICADVICAQEEILLRKLKTRLTVNESKEMSWEYTRDPLRCGYR